MIDIERVGWLMISTLNERQSPTYLADATKVSTVQWINNKKTLMFGQAQSTRSPVDFHRGMPRQQSFHLGDPDSQCN